MVPQTTHKDRYEKLLEAVSANDIVCIPIVADPDAIASALALKRLFWRKVQKTIICRVNAINRSDNLAMIRDLKITLPYIKRAKTSDVTKWAIVDSQPHHHKLLANIPCSIIIDHHPPDSSLETFFLDIRQDYGATSSMMTEYLKAANIVPSAKLATALFYGIKSDTNNFTRSSIYADIKAFRYLYSRVNLNLIKKIEASEINKKNITSFRKAFDVLSFIGDTAYIHMGSIKDADALVIIADFFLKIAEASWCVVSGVYGKKTIIIIRYAGFRLHAGKIAQLLFGEQGSAGGHKSAARAEIPLAFFADESDEFTKIRDYIISQIKKR